MKTRSNPIPRCDKAVGRIPKLVREFERNNRVPLWDRLIAKRPAVVRNRYIWHVTHADNVKSVLRRGLLPAQPNKGEIGYREYSPRVFVSRKLDTIKEMARYDYGRARGGKWVALRIDTTKLPKTCVFHDPNVPDNLGWMWTFSSIPARAIEVFEEFDNGIGSLQRKPRIARGVRSNPRRWGRLAAGVLIQALDTKRVLLLLRSAEVMEPGTWGLPGGKVDEGEDTAEAVWREVEEELGIPMLPGSDMAHLYTFSEENFRFVTYLGHVHSESSVRPVLNWESDDARWFSLKRMPKNLHPGIVVMMKDASARKKLGLR